MTRWSDVKEAVLAAAASLLILLLSLAFVSTSVITIPPPSENRWLSERFLTATYNAEQKSLWAASPEVVTSILWDYRGLDTVYETSVFFLAIIGALMLVRSYKQKRDEKLPSNGMSVIAKTITKITLVAIPVVAASIALHGHLTPGGGFQGGSVFAVATLLAIVAMGTGFLANRGWSKGRLLGLRTLGLIVIVFVAIAVPIIGYMRGVHAYIMQNQEKPWSSVGLGYVYELLGHEVLYSGTLLFLNLAEFLAVSAGLTLVFLIMALPREKIYKGGDME